MSKVVGLILAFIHLIVAFLIGIDMIEPNKFSLVMVYIVAGLGLLSVASRE
ncbi:hypothetical protein vBBceHLY2_00160 [Bacillus phage vB_BceH_LY2]|nr:hypothetical protein vBBceHLY2_00160 [Bacillus phage vB_BceH_LY2]